MVMQEYTPSEFFTTAVSFAVHNFKSCEFLPKVPTPSENTTRGL